MAYREDPEGSRTELSLKNSNGQYVQGIDRSAPLNMLVFWASWCGPCRLEIPQLKALEEEFKDQSLNIVSISIDKKQDDWIKALEQEEMSWEQYIIPVDSIRIVQAKYNFNAIPLVIFTDSKGNELKRFEGFH